MQECNKDNPIRVNVRSEVLDETLLTMFARLVMDGDADGYTYDPTSPIILTTQTDTNTDGKVVFDGRDIADACPHSTARLVFKRSIDKQIRQPNEYAMPEVHKPSRAVAVSASLGVAESTYNSPNRKLATFMGQTNGWRDWLFDAFKLCREVDSNVVIRRTFLGGLKPADPRYRDYLKSILAGKFVICARGHGNYSYRFYEALALGRVPIMLDTNCVLPFEDKLDWNKYVIRVPFRSSMDEAADVIDAAVNKEWPSPQDIHRFWRMNLSLSGFFNNIRPLIKESFNVEV